jgi:hypothetical protein
MEFGRYPEENKDALFLLGAVAVGCYDRGVGKS